jgi:hypothetical protein
MGQLNLLKSEPLNVDTKDYYNDKKSMYEIVPVFPFLSEETIREQVNAVIDENKFSEEVKLINAYAKKDQSIIEGTNYIISLVAWKDYPQLILLLTIIREWAFRNEGGGVGDFDTDEFDDLPEMKQLMILNPEYDEPLAAIIGGYRYMEHHRDSYHAGPVGAHFKFSDQWKNELWIELGRSFINPYYKERERKQSFDYVLHGLGYIYAKNPSYKGYFGKVTLYKIYEITGADAFFLACAKKYWDADENVQVIEGEEVAEGQLTEEQMEILNTDIFKGLFLKLRKEFKVNIVPIMAVYNRMVDLDKMKYFGAFRHKSFGDTTEVGIAIAFDDIYPVIKKKFANHYL